LPGSIPFTVKFMMRTRLSDVTLYPSASHILRICLLSPCVRMMRKRLSPSCFTKHGLVTCFNILTPLRMAVMNSWSIFLSVVTMYSFSCPLPARRILFTISPSLVRKINPSESLSSLPIGKDAGLKVYVVDNVRLIFLICGACNTLRLIQHDINRQCLLLYGLAVYLHHIIRLYPVTFISILPLMVTRHSSMYLSASRLLQKPLSLMYLFKLISMYCYIVVRLNCCLTLCVFELCAICQPELVEGGFISCCRSAL
jgi:hypothetical protein